MRNLRNAVAWRQWKLSTLQDRCGLETSHGNRYFFTKCLEEGAPGIGTAYALPHCMKAFLPTVLLAFGLNLMACAGADEVETEDLSDEENAMGVDQNLRAGRVVPKAEIADLLRQNDIPESAIGKLVCAAKWESSFYAKASNKNDNGSMDRGLFQVNSIHLGSMRGCPSKSNASTLYEPEVNVKCAAAIYRAQGMNAWYGYRAHRTECNNFSL